MAHFFLSDAQDCSPIKLIFFRVVGIKGSNFTGYYPIFSFRWVFKISDINLNILKILTSTETINVSLTFI